MAALHTKAGLGEIGENPRKPYEVKHASQFCVEAEGKNKTKSKSGQIT